MDMNKYLNSDYIKVEDVKEHNVWVCKEIAETKFEEETKLQINLEHKGNCKSLTLNATNTKRLIEIFGSDTKDVEGKIIVLKLVDTEFKGKEFIGIRIDVEETKASNKEK